MKYSPYCEWSYRKKIRFRNVQIKVSLAFKRRRSLQGLLIFPRGVITVADQCVISLASFQLMITMTTFWPFLVKFGPIFSPFFQLMITKTTVIPIKLKFLAHLALCLEYLSPYFWYELRRVGHFFKRIMHTFPIVEKKYFLQHFLSWKKIFLMQFPLRSLKQPDALSICNWLLKSKFGKI